MWGATWSCYQCPAGCRFQSTHPVWGATTGWRAKTPPTRHFNPRTPCGVRQEYISRSAAFFGFQSTHPVWGATRSSGRDAGAEGISIHAPRVGCDWLRTGSGPMQVISIHAPRVGCDESVIACRLDGIVFQSTHPVWGATFQETRRQGAHQISIHAPRVGCDAAPRAGPATADNFNPRTPCGVRRPKRAPSLRCLWISIHAPRVGCDRNTVQVRVYNRKFQSTHPVWGATLQGKTNDILAAVFQSTHPVWGATPPGMPAMLWTCNFNPRTPCGVRRRSGWQRRLPCGISIHAPRVGCDMVEPKPFALLFISIHAPRVGCDGTGGTITGVGEISIHAPRVGCDNRFPPMPGTQSDFNPRTPCGVRQALGGKVPLVWRISIHAPRVGCDCPSWSGVFMILNFNPRTPCGVRPDPGERV